MITFGKKNAIKMYWTRDEFVGFSVKEKRINSSGIPWLKDSAVLFNEVFLNLRYAANNSFYFTKSPWDDSLSYLRNYAIIIDAHLIGHVWEKWSSEFPSLQERTIHNQHIDQDDLELDFQSWFLMCKSGLTPPRKYDESDKLFLYFEK